VFRRTRKNLVYLFIPLLLFFIFFSYSEVFTPIKFKIIQASAAPIRIFSFPFKELKKILYYHRTFKEYRRLKGETDFLKARLIGLEEVIRENKRLEDLLEFKRTLVYSSVVANVIGRNPSLWNSSMIIDKGEGDGVKQGQPVVNALGVVGKVAEVGPKTSKVILLIDPQFSVAALVQEPRESGLVSGSLQGVCRLRFIKSNATIQLGDTVITSKLSSSFPEGLLIGEIIKIEENPKSDSIECLVAPAVSLSQLEEVLVIVN